MYWIVETTVTGVPTIGFVFAVYVWAVFLIRLVYAIRHLNVGESTNIDCSVVIPVFDENPCVFGRCLTSLRANHRGEVVVVVNGFWDDAEKIVSISKSHDAEVLRQDQADKRLAIVGGCLEAKGEIIILLDSDTTVEPDAVEKILQPFSISDIGGVCGRQRIRNSHCSLVARISDWLESLRFLINQRSQSHFGAVGCLPGRMIAIRRDVILRNAENFANQTVLGIRCKSGDDRYLTSCCLREGYKTVLRSDALVFTESPTGWRNFLLQQLRWARSSQRETILSVSWLFHHPFTFFCFVIDIVTPVFFLVVAYNYFFGAEVWKSGVLHLLILTWVFATFSLGLRQFPHLAQHVRDILILPVFTIIAATLVFVRVYGLLTCLLSGWMTRSTK
ncbi:MAG: glycosyltransferase [Pseudomonadota bacterium]